MTADEIIRSLQRGGWRIVRQEGSHIRLENADKPRNAVTVALHSSKDIPIGTFHAILKRAGLSKKEFDDLRRS